MKSNIIILCSLFLLMTASVFSDENTANKQNNDSTKTNAIKSEQFVISYLHMNRRCATCKKLETYSEEAIKTGFVKELKDSTLTWKSINFEDEGNEHFAKTYQLYSQSLVISKLIDGKETQWKNLDKIWSLTDDKEKYITYVQNSVKEFITESAKE